MVVLGSVDTGAAKTTLHPGRHFHNKTCDRSNINTTATCSMNTNNEGFFALKIIPMLIILLLLLLVILVLSVEEAKLVLVSNNCISCIY